MQFVGLRGGLGDGRRDVGNLGSSAQDSRFEDNIELDIGSAADLDRAFAILKSGFRSANGPRTAGERLEVGDPAGFGSTRGDLGIGRSDPDLGAEDGRLLGVFYENAQFAGLASLSDQRYCTGEEKERDVTGRMS